MSKGYYKHGEFGIFPAFQLKGMNPYHQVVLAWLIFHTNQDGYCWPSMKTLMTETGIKSRSKLRSVIIELEQAGIIESQNRNREDGSVTSNGYRIIRSCPHRDAADPPPQDGGAPTVIRQAPHRHTVGHYIEPESKNQNQENQIPPDPLKGGTSPKKAIAFPEALKRARDIFRKRDSTPPDRSERLAWEKARPAMEEASAAEWEAVEKYYALPPDKEDVYHRTSLATFMNNFNAEVSKSARYFATNTEKNAIQYGTIPSGNMSR